MRFVALALALLVAGCGSVRPAGPPVAVAPDLRGAWTGTWGGAPASLIVTEQTTGPGGSSLVVGPWQVLGESYPVATGVLTSTIQGGPSSTHMHGLLSDSGGGVVLNVQARSGAGDQWLTLRLVDADRLEGMGESQFSWGSQGFVQLIRQHRPAATAR